MSDDEDFLARWSRRKRRATVQAPGLPPETALTQPEASTAPSPLEEPRPQLDLASLPPIDSIGAGSDIRAFLAPGVPAELTRAALRRLWSADPAIRDFIGLSENAWDFNAPGGVPGFGSVRADDARRLLAQAIGALQSAEQPGAAAPSATVKSPLQTRDLPQPSPLQAADGPEQYPARHLASGDAAVAHRPGQPESTPPPRRRYGGALPE
jgi:Protein of unknown function (DUF3306)